MAEDLPIQDIVPMADKHYGAGEITFLNFFIDNMANLVKGQLGLFFLNRSTLY